MNPFGKFAIHVLTATLLFSAWAGAELPCPSPGAETLYSVTASQDSIEQALDDVTTVPDQCEQEVVASMSDSPCCDDDCAMVCATMGSSALASVSVTSESQYDVHARLTARTVSFRPQPPPQSLFRPPIS